MSNFEYGMNAELRNEIESFNLEQDFKNAFDVFFFEFFPIESERGASFEQVCTRNGFENLRRARDVLQQHCDLFVMQAEKKSLTGNYFIVDYRCNHYHFHLYLPCSYVLDLNCALLNFPRLLETTQCPICYERLQCFFVKCPRCGINICQQCADHLSPYCGFCQYDARIRSEEYFLFGGLEKLEREIPLYFIVNDEETDTKVIFKCQVTEGHKTGLLYALSTGQFHTNLLRNKHLSNVHYCNNSCLGNGPVHDLHLKLIT